MRVLIVDDEALAADRLARLCARLSGLEIIGIAADGQEALSQVEALKPDLVLLDISMPGMDGLDLARALASRPPRPAIVFVTAHSHHAVAAFELAASDYLLKPVSQRRLGQAVARVAAQRASLAPRPAYLTEIWAPSSRDMIRIGVDMLDLLEAERDYVRLHARGRTFLIRSTLRDLEYRLDPDRFVRVHRSMIVPVNRISGVRRDQGGALTVLLSTGSTVPVGRSFQSLIRRVTVGPS